MPIQPAGDEAVALSTKDRAAGSRGNAVAISIIAAMLCVAAAMTLVGLWSGRPGAMPFPKPRPIAATVAVEPAAPPPVEPTVFAAMTPDRARAVNAAIPFAAGAVPPARPLLYAGSPIDRAAARTCLAAAALYEAGDDRPGEEAVAQVVLNRVRHPAFPKTICGVVFQGSDRATGCQFTFTCDGSLARQPSPAAWRRATDVADAALSGFVAKPVGTATHYHADWVVPYWHSALEKIAQVHSQIFYRWANGWGRPAAFTARPQPFERIDPRIVALAGPSIDDATATSLLAAAAADAPQPARTSLAVAGVPTRALKGNIVRLKDDAAAQYVLQIAHGASPATLAVVGFTICGEHPDCIVMAWDAEDQTPRALPVPPLAMRSVAFVYRKSSLTGSAQPYWDCRRYPRAVASQCLPGSGRR